MSQRNANKHSAFHHHNDDEPYVATAAHSEQTPPSTTTTTTSVDILKSLIPPDFQPPTNEPQHSPPPTTTTIGVVPQSSHDFPTTALPNDIESLFTGLDQIESLSHEASSHKLTLMDRMQHSLRQLHTVRETFEDMLKDENIDELQQISHQLQKMTKNLFSQLNQVLEERDVLAERAEFWKSSLRGKDENLIRVMKREEIQVRKLRESLYSQKRLKERREEMIRLVFTKAEEQALTASEFRQLYEQTVALYDTDSLHPVELHGKYGLKTQIAEDNMVGALSGGSSHKLRDPSAPAKKRTVVFNFSSLKDQRTVDYVRNQIKKDREWVLRVLETKDEHINNIVKQADTYYQRDEVPDAPDLRSQLADIKQKDLNSSELQHLLNYKIEPNKNLSFQKVRYNVNRMVNDIYAAHNSDSKEDEQVKQGNLSNLKTIHDMILPVLSKFDPHFQSRHKKMNDDIRVLREKCEEMKRILRAFLSDYKVFMKAAWADFKRIRKMLENTILKLQAQLDKIRGENDRLREANDRLHSEAGQVPPPIKTEAPQLSPILAPRTKLIKDSSPPARKKHVCQHHEKPSTAPIERPCYSRVSRNHFRDLPPFRLPFGDRQQHPREVDVSLWFQEPEEDSPRVRRFDRILHPFLNRSVTK